MSLTKIAKRTRWVAAIHGHSHPERMTTNIHSLVYGDTLSELIADAFNATSSLMAQGYQAEIMELEKLCAECDGRGTKLKRGTSIGVRKTCAACHGKGRLETFPVAEFKLPRNVQIVEVSP